MRFIAKPESSKRLPVFFLLAFLLSAPCFSQAEAIAADVPCDGALDVSSADSRFGTYFMFSGSPSQDHANLFSTPNSWLRTRQRALMEETFLHELKLDLAIDKLMKTFNSRAVGIRPVAGLNAMEFRKDEHQIHVTNGQRKISLRLYRRVFTNEPIKVEIEYVLAGEASPESAIFYFPDSYRRPKVQGEETRPLRRRRLTWGLSERFQGAWSPELFELMIDVFVHSGTVSAESRPSILEQRDFPRNAEISARTYFSSRYPEGPQAR